MMITMQLLRRSRLRWYLLRLRAMGLSEIALRARRTLATALDDATWRHGRPLWRHAWHPPDSALFAERPALDSPLGFLTAERAASLAGELPEAADAAVARAEQVLTGRVNLLGYPEVVLPDPPDWSRDPFTGRTWPDRHGKLLDYRRAEYGDPKWIWELNRCQELPLLALAWRLSGDERFATAAVRRMLDWIEHSEPGRGIAWSNGFEAGLRAISFALAYDALRGSPALGRDRATSILRALWQHARFALRDRSPESSANNHLVGELAGVATVGLLAPELRDADRFREHGLAGLAREAERQILPDGTGAEQAFAYHLFVLDLFLLVAALAGARSVELPAAVPSALAQARKAIDAQVQGAEPDPAYGDGDDGRAFVLDAAERRDARAVSSTIAAYLGQPVTTPDPVTLLLFHPFGPEHDASAPPRDALLPESGIVVLRRGPVRVLFDAGPLGYLSIAAHGHADALQVTVADDDLDVVTDPGTGSYYGDGVRRSAFRGTGFHATVTVDGLDQAEQAGPFLWRRHYRAQLRMCDLERGIIVGDHDGYTRLADPVAHSRALLALADGSLLVVDRLDANGVHHYTQTWPLHPSLEARAVDDFVEALLGPEQRLRLYTASSPPGRLRLRRGETVSFAGWWSRRLEAAEPAWTVAHEVECGGGASFATLLVVSSAGTACNPRVSVEFDGRTTHVGFVHKGLEWQFELDLSDAKRPARVASSSTDDIVR